MIQIQRLCPENDANTRIYFSRETLTERCESALRGGPRRARNPVLAAALEIPGVAVASVMPYSLAVTKAPSFTWDEVEDPIRRLLVSLNIGIGALES